MAAVIATFTFATEAGAQVRKEDNLDTLGLATSWIGGAAAPGIADIAQWDDQLTGANTSDLGATPSSWLGIKVLSPTGAVGITGTSPGILTLGASGIDLSAATQNLTIGSPLILGGAQTWKVASGRVLRVNTAGAAAISGVGPLTLTGPGQVRIGGTGGTYTFTGGISVGGGTGTNNIAATGAPSTTNTNLFIDLAAISPGTALTLGLPALTTNGGIIHTNGGTGSGTTAYIPNFASINVAAGNTSFTMQRGSSARAIFQFQGTPARAAGATVNFRDDISGSGASNANSGGYRMATAANVNGVVPWATYNTTSTGIAWFVAAGTGNNGTSAPTLTASTATSLGTATQNSNVVTDVAIGASTSVNTIRFNDGSSRTVTIDPAATLSIGAGAILVTNNGSANQTITGGKIVGGSPGSGSGKDLIIHQHHNSSTFTIASEIADYSEVVGETTVVTPTPLTKSGAGKLAIGGAATYTGNTFVNAGTLLVNGTLTGSPLVKVNRGGALGGTGSVTAPVTVNGSIAPGTSVGTLTTGPVTFNAGSTLAIELNTYAGTSDKLVTSGITTGGSMVNLTLTDVGGDVTLANGTKFTLVDYAGTWSGTDLLTYAGFPLENHTTIALGANTYFVDYADAAVDGTALTLTVTGAPVLTPYLVWSDSFALQLPNPADRQPTADPDKDGKPNSFEFALDGNPASFTNAGKISVSTLDSNDAGSDRELSVTLAVRNGAVLATQPDGSVTLTVDDIVYTIQGSQNLVDWNEAISEVTPPTPLVPAANIGWTARTFQVTDSNGLPSRRFLQVSVTP
ncbi:beta strand repeat-containing protein [Luteolibacter soli]